MGLRLFISGGMRGWPGYNWAAFDEIEERLRGLDISHDIVTPANLDREAGIHPDDDLDDASMRGNLNRSIAAMLTCDAVVVTKGWKKSKGALGELYCARAAGMLTFKLVGDELVELDPDEAEFDVLLEAIELTSGERQSCYGAPNKDFDKISKMWSALFGIAISPSDVAMAMILLKVSRESHSFKPDNWRDIAGYARCGYQVAMEQKDLTSGWHPTRLHALSSWCNKREHEPSSMEARK
jgi:hypothetical protein